MCASSEEDFRFLFPFEEVEDGWRRNDELVVIAIGSMSLLDAVDCS